MEILIITLTIVPSLALLYYVYILHGAYDFLCGSGDGTLVLIFLIFYVLIVVWAFKLIKREAANDHSLSITTEGIATGKYSQMVQSQVTLDDLFKE